MIYIYSLFYAKKKYLSFFQVNFFMHSPQTLTLIYSLFFKKKKPIKFSLVKILIQFRDANRTVWDLKKIWNGSFDIFTSFGVSRNEIYRLADSAIQLSWLGSRMISNAYFDVILIGFFSVAASWILHSILYFKFRNICDFFVSSLVVELKCVFFLVGSNK